MNLLLPVEITCGGCGERLKAEVYEAFNQISVTPCKKCVNDPVKVIRAEVTEALDRIENATQIIWDNRTTIEEAVKER